MPDIRKVTEVDPKSENLDEDLDPGNYWVLFAVLEGTTDTGESVALSDIADNVIVELDGRQIAKQSWEYFHNLVDEWKGTVENTAPTADVTRIGMAIPFWYPEEEANAINVTSDSELNLRIEFNQSTLSTRFGSNTATVTLYRWLAADTPENYVPYHLVSETNLTSGTVGKEDVLRNPNIARLLIEDPSDAISRIDVEYDDSLVVKAADLAALNDLANLLNRVESSPDTLNEYNPFQGPGSPGFNRNFVRVTYDGQATGTVKLTRIERRTR